MVDPILPYVTLAAHATSLATTLVRVAARILGWLPVRTPARRAILWKELQPRLLQILRGAAWMMGSHTGSLTEGHWKLKIDGWSEQIHRLERERTSLCEELAAGRSASEANRLLTTAYRWARDVNDKMEKWVPASTYPIEVYWNETAQAFDMLFAVAMDRGLVEELSTVGRVRFQSRQE